MTLDLLTFIGSLQRQPQVSVNSFSAQRFSDICDDDAGKVLRSVPTIKHLSFGNSLLALDSGSQGILTLEHLQDIMETCPKLESLSLMSETRSAVANRHRKVDHNQYDANQRNASSFLQLRELHLSGEESIRTKEACLVFLRAFQWSRLERLAISGGSLAELILSRFGAEMTSLRSLRVAVFPSPTTFSWTAPEQTHSAVSEFLATKSLMELELDGFSKDLPMELAASTKLRKLRLHSWEADSAGAQAHLRSAHEIRAITALAPNLEHLMLDVGSVSKLWHPTAIPGVDLDVNVYQMFDALSQLTRLKILHLFPRYCTLDDNGRNSWKQAIEDDGQAVRIFKHLKAIQPSLELLILSIDNVIARLADIDPMRWSVCQIGKTILLRVRQANKEYEQQQIWQGQRRLRTEIKRYSYSDPYLDGLGPRLPSQQS